MKKSPNTIQNGLVFGPWLEYGALGNQTHLYHLKTGLVFESWLYIPNNFRKNIWRKSLKRFVNLTWLFIKITLFIKIPEYFLFELFEKINADRYLELDQIFFPFLVLCKILGNWFEAIILSFRQQCLKKWDSILRPTQ